MRLPDINQLGGMISDTVWCTFQWTKPEHGRGEKTEQEESEWGETAWVGHWCHAHRTGRIREQEEEEAWNNDAEVFEQSKLFQRENMQL